MNYKALFELAEIAKVQGVIEIANIVFAILLVQSRNHNRKTESHTPDLWVELETSDPDGNSPQEVYYDLFYLCHHEDGHSFQLCCPAPLIQTHEQVSALKRSSGLRESVVHSRTIISPTPDEEKRLWQALKDLVTEEDACNAVSAVFCITDNRGNFPQAELKIKIHAIYN